MSKPIYWGLFLESPLPTMLHQWVRNQHVTFGFRTEIPEGVELGKETEVKVIGRGCDGRNEGYQVELTPQQKMVYGGALVPHITVGLCGGKPVDTAKLSFEPIKPFVIKARWGKFEGK